MHRSHLAGLDGLRGIAALCVLLLHVSLFFDLSGAAAMIGNHAYLAVDCFYMISGFVIAHAFDRKMRDGLSPSRFLVSRVLRLYPMLLVGSFLGVITLSGFFHVHPEIPTSSMLSAIIMGIVLLPSRALIEYKSYVFPLNSSYWSLSLEFGLYLSYAFLFTMMLRRWIVCSMLVLSAIALAYTALANGSLDVGYRSADYPLGFARCIFPFLAGIAMRRSSLYMPKTLPLGSLCIFLALPLLCNTLPRSATYDLATDIFVYPVIIIVASNSTRMPRLDTFSTSLGNLSYPLYAIHYPIAVMSGNVCRILHLPTIHAYLAALFCSTGTIVLAAWLSKVYDEPLRRILTQRLAVTAVTGTTREVASIRTPADVDDRLPIARASTIESGSDAVSIADPQAG